MLPPKLRLKEEEQFQLNQLLKDYLKQTESNFALLINLDGYLIVSQGDTANIDLGALTVLSVGLFASAQQIAELIGEEDFKTFFYQGKKFNLHTSSIGNMAILLTVFEKTTLSIIRLFSKETCNAVRKIMMESENE
ncbi:MAG: roadblock/LC7 domain-containing protein [Acidobacteria bacterium]|nr:roadblock/LC7 domain-containing protein [Acidobacteriota bacterium]